MDAFVKPLARDPNAEHDDNRPDRSEVEAALRTIIRWTGDDPDRPGLLETPARVTRAFEEYFAGYAQDPALLLQKTFEEIEGYDEMIVLGGNPLREPLRTSLGAHHRPCLGCIRSTRARRRHQQTCARRGRLCEAPADPGKDDGPDRRHDRKGFCSPRASASSSRRRITA